MSRNTIPIAEAGEKPKERPKRARKKPAPEVSGPAKATTALPHESEYARRGRVASQLAHEETNFLVEPWVPLSLLTLVAGEPNSGKSSLFAWIMAQPGKSVILPGSEEKPELLLLPRLVAAGCDMSRILILDDQAYHFPRDKKLVAGIAKHWGANRILMDPVDSYMADGESENDGQVVRPFLESLEWVAREAQCAVVAARHPGKEPGNILPGSRQWRTVPRQVVELVKIPGVPVRRIIRLEKDGISTGAQATYFHLDKAQGKAKRFRLGEPVDGVSAAMAKEVDGPGRRWAVTLACQLIREVFHDEEDPTVEELNARAAKKGIGQNSLDEAKRLLGITCKPTEKGGKWHMQREEEAWPEWLPSCDY